MTKLVERFDRLGQRVKGQKQTVPTRLAEKMDSILNGDDEIHESSKVQESNEVSLSLYESENLNLPASKKTTIPTPNVILRSALFGVVKKGNRQYEERVSKGTFSGYTVKYTGKQLDQSDLDVWLECIQRCQSTPLGHTVRFAANDFLLSLNRNTGKSDHEWLKSSLLRLRTNDVEISDGKYTYMGSLIFEQYRDEENGDNCLILNPKIVACFGDAGWTGITKAIRLQLKGKPLTQWLHGFYSSHAKPVPIKVETLRSICGSSVNELYKFRQMVKKSLIELSSATGWQCHINESDLVIIKK